jgi:hypothetical protein
MKGAHHLKELRMITDQARWFRSATLIIFKSASMIRRRWGQIISLSPPLDLTMVLGRIAYSISKLGMTLLTQGPGQ